METEVRGLPWTLYPNMVQIRVPGDGSCYFNAIAKAFFTPYRTGFNQGVPVNRQQIIQQFRSELAQRLQAPGVYESLSEGALKEFGPEYSRSQMISTLLGSGPVDYVYQELISDEINKDIYLLSSVHQDVVNLTNPKLLYKNRDSIVLLYTPGHYDLIGLQGPDGVIRTVFNYDDPFIVKLRSRFP